MKKSIIALIISALFVIFGGQFVACIAKEKKALPKFEEVDKNSGVYIIRYSNIVTEVENKKIKIPIYGGMYEDISYDDLEKLQTNKKLYLLGNLNIDAKDGEVKKTFFDILSFYKKTFFKDIDTNNPSVIGNEGGDSLFVWYDFDYEGMPCSMMITVAYDKKATNEKISKIRSGMKKEEPFKRTLDMIEFKEDSKWIGLQILLGQDSGFKKK